MAGPEKAAWMREFALAEDIDLRWSVAYSDDAADLPMLSMVGRPVAVNPDTRLLATARSHGWPVLIIEANRSPARELAQDALELTRRGVRRAQREVATRAGLAGGGGLVGGTLGATFRAMASARSKLRAFAEGEDQA